MRWLRGRREIWRRREKWLVSKEYQSVRRKRPVTVQPNPFGPTRLYLFIIHLGGPNKLYRFLFNSVYWIIAQQQGQTLNIQPIICYVINIQQSRMAINMRDIRNGFFFFFIGSPDQLARTTWPPKMVDVRNVTVSYRISHVQS